MPERRALAARRQIPAGSGSGIAKAHREQGDVVWIAKVSIGKTRPLAKPIAAVVFLIFVPFLIIDMAVASILMSMGMMMLPPVIISLPFKLIFFVLVDGWRLVAGSLVESYLHSPPPS